ncbi:MAG: sensor domain-containing diguanylate cyclase [Methylophilus sp.]|nr:sensor domain-containing diguanylate cyclase [Methylophilus sp.]
MGQVLQCPIPSNEVNRLKSLYSYDILDTLPEVEFDTLTRLAANALKMPAAVIGLMDSDRIWIKSKIGLDVPQLDRKIAFCAHAIMRPDEVLVSENLAEDSRFVSNPLVAQSPHLRFYAGASLTNQEGYALGAIAVVDVIPRVLNDVEKAMLKDFANLVMLAIESRKAANVLQTFAMTDQLTGLANRVQFERVLNAEISHARRTHTSFKLLMMDLDNFKAVNDTYGHAAGDEVLKQFAQRMLGQLRVEDLFARLGGDEFGLLVRGDCDQYRDAIVARMNQAISAPIQLSNGKEVSIGVSIGSVVYTDEISSVGAMLAIADESLYQDKRG